MGSEMCIRDRHLIPRKAGDQAVPEWEHLSLSDDEMKEICDKMKM